MSPFYKAHIAVLSTNLLYGFIHIAGKNVMPIYLTPLALTMVRALTSLSLFWIFCMFIPSEKIERKDMIRIWIAGLFGVALNQMLFMKGLNLSSPVDSAIIMTTNPIMTLIISALILKEIITPLKITGIALGAAGALLLVLQHGTLSLDHTLGNIILLLNCLSFAIYLVIIKPIMGKYNTMTIMKWVFTSGFIYLIPFGTSDFININWNAMPTEIYLSIVYITLGATFLTYLLSNYALRTLKASTVSIYIYVQPVVAGMAAVALNVEQISWIQILASLMVFGGIITVSAINRIFPN